MQSQLIHFFSLTVGKILRIPLVVLSTSLLARIVGPEGVGQWAMILAVATLFHSCLINWTDSSNVRFGCKEWVLKNRLANTWSARWPLIAAGTCLASALTIFQPFSFLEKLFNLPPSWWPLLLMFVFGEWFRFESQSIARVTGKIGRLTLIPIWVDLTTIAFLATIFFQSSFPEIQWTLSGMIFFSTLASGIAWIIEFRDSQSWGGKSNWKERKKIIKYSSPLIPGLLFAYLSNWGDHILLQYFMSTKDVGLFSAGYQIMLALAALSSPIHTLFLPKLIKKKLFEPDVETNYLGQIAPTVISFWLLTIIPILAFVPLIFNTIFGGEFADSIPALLLLCASVPSSIFISIYVILFEIQGRLGKSSYYLSIMLLINILISLALVINFGVIGVAIGTTTSYFLLQILFTLDQHRFLKIPIKKVIILFLFCLFYGLAQYFIGENLLFRVGGALLACAFLIPLIRSFSMVDKTILTNLLSGKLLSLRPFFFRLLI